MLSVSVRAAVSLDIYTVVEPTVFHIDQCKVDRCLSVVQSFDS